MKRLAFLLLFFLLFSCAAQNTRLSSFVAIYTTVGHNYMPPSIIVLRAQPQLFELYEPAIQESIFGQWCINKDTLLLAPLFDLLSRESELKIVSQLDTSLLTVPHKYLIDRDCLIDITDYRGILPEPLNSRISCPKYKYRRVNLDKKRLD